MIAILFAAALCTPSQPKNFGEVSANDGSFAGIYRGAQPVNCSEIEYLKQLGVKTIVKLNDSGSKSDRVEKSEAEAAGIRVESFDIDPFAIGEKKTCGDVDRVLDILADAKNRPVYVHCVLGRDRTGYIIGAYEEVALHKPVRDVLEELKAYGYHGYPTLIFRQIRRELRSGSPGCTAGRAR